jgi:hypothetical protein
MHPVAAKLSSAGPPSGRLAGVQAAPPAGRAAA